MLMSQIPVSLSEVLEVRNESGLSDGEILSILQEGIAPLEELIENARASSVRNMSLSPESVYFLPDGTIQLKPLPCDDLDVKFLPPEYAQTIQQENAPIFILDLNKVYIYAFGAVLSFALESGSQGTITSPEIYSLLNLMTVRDPSVRLPLPKIAQMTEKHIKLNNIDVKMVIRSLFRSIMGSEEDFANLSFDDFTHKQSMDASTAFSDEDFRTSPPSNEILEDRTFLYNKQIQEKNLINTSTTISNVSKVTELQPRMAELDKHPSSTISGKKVLTVPFMDNNNKLVNNNNSDAIVDNSSVVNEVPRVDILSKYDEGVGLLVDLSTENIQTPVTVGSPSKMDRPSWINFEKSPNIADKRHQFRQSSNDAFSSSEDLDGLVFGTISNDAASNSVENVLRPESVHGYNDSGESTTASPRAPPSSGFPNYAFDSFKAHSPFSLESSEVDEGLDVFSIESHTERMALSETAKMRVLEKLMPTTPFDFTKPKEHGSFERTRIYHSVDCQFCSPIKKSVCYIEAQQRRRSLPNLFFDYEISARRYYVTKPYSALAFNARPDLFVEARNTPDSLKQYSDSSLSSPLAGKKSPFLLTTTNVDPVFASFEDLSTISKDDENLERTWHKVEIERPSSSSSVNSQAKSIGDKNRASVERDYEKQRSTLNAGYNEDELQENSKFPSRQNGAIVLEPIDENLVELSPAETIEHRPASPARVTLYAVPQEKENATVSPSALYRKLSREGSMRIKSDGSIRGSGRHQRPHVSTGDRKLSTDSGTKTVPILGVHQIISQQQRKNDERFVQQQFASTSSAAVVTNIPAVFHPAHQKRQLSSVNQNMPGKPSEESRKGPEFFYKSRQPSIRLKAPSAQRSKKLFKHALERNVLVILLNGQRVDVACRTDCTAENIFEVVSSHTNLMERHFFGLSLLKDGEHYFLEPENKLQKFAPPGWRHSSRDVINARVVFTLFLRLKYYPVTLDFVKTEQTLHQIYLQLRRDVLDERLQCGKDVAYQLAALALQAEYGDRPWDSTDYFSVNLYLPLRHFSDEMDEDRIRVQLAELHGQYAGTSQKDAETDFVKMCQNLREYGIHFHRIYRTKPSQLLTPSPLGDPETGTSLWIGIMPRGVIIFEEKTGERVPVDQYPWLSIETLQFDHKRLVIFPVSENHEDPNNRPKFLFYTDDHKKSMYFVNFAAIQHRFCIKMRQWAATLPIDKQFGSLDRHLVHKVNGHTENASNRSSATESDSGFSRGPSPEVRADGRVVHNNRHERAVDAVVPPRSTPVLNPRMPTVPTPTVAEIVIPAQDISNFSNANDTISESFVDRLNNASSPTAVAPLSDFQTFTVKLVKDPHYGLGLTLVDGEIQGIKGVYVRSLTPGGPAELEGRLRLADKLISVNGVSLEGKTRHNAVDLVRQSSNEVTMTILRMKNMYSSTESVNGATTVNSFENGTKRINGANKPLSSPMSSSTPRVFSSTDRDDFVSVDNDDDDDDDESEPTPTPAPRVVAAHRSVENLKNNVTKDKKSSDSNLLFDNSGLKTDELYRPASDNTFWLHETGQSGGLNFVERPAGETMYGGLQSDSENSAPNSDVDDEDEDEKVASSPNRNKKPTLTVGSVSSPASEDDVVNRLKMASDKNLHNLGVDSPNKILGHFTKSSEKLNKDWTEDIAWNDISKVDWKTDELESIVIVLEKNEHGSLGIQVAGGKGQKKVYVKSLVAEPAVSAGQAKKIMPGDQLASVNQTNTRGLTHQEVVNLLKTAKSPVELGLLRPIKPAPSSLAQSTSGAAVNFDASIIEGTVETLDVLLEKPASGSLGLSLAKPPKGEGIYIKVIAPGSVAAVDGRLRSGDRLWMINGDSVALASPAEVVEKLKAAQGFVKLIVKRELKEKNGTN